MGMTKAEARDLLRARGMRATAPRVAVLVELSKAARPLSYAEMLARLGECEWDPTTVYRNLIKLRDAGVATALGRVDGIDRYELIGDGPDGGSTHAHFLCNACGTLSCLPAEVTASLNVEGRWAKALDGATVQFRGTCPDCES